MRARLGRGPADVPPYRVEAGDLGVRPGIDLDDIQGLVDRLDELERR